MKDVKSADIYSTARTLFEKDSVDKMLEGLRLNWETFAKLDKVSLTKCGNDFHQTLFNYHFKEEKDMRHLKKLQASQVIVFLKLLSFADDISANEYQLDYFVSCFREDMVAATDDLLYQFARRLNVDNRTGLIEEAFYLTQNSLGASISAACEEFCSYECVDYINSQADDIKIVNAGSVIAKMTGVARNIEKARLVVKWLTDPDFSPVLNKFVLVEHTLSFDTLGDLHRRMTD